MNLAFKIKKVKLGSTSLLLGSLIVFVLISIEEFSQIFIANRTFDLGDLFFNYLGIFVFGWLAVLYLKTLE